MTFTPPTAGSGLALQATTGIAGFAKQNATPNIISWTAPNDGNMHRVLFFASETVTALETGGGVGVIITVPGGGTQAAGTALFAGAKAAGSYHALDGAIVAPGTTVTINQSAALTAGACTVFAEIWGN